MAAQGRTSVRQRGDSTAAYGETLAGRLLTAILEVRDGEYWLLTTRKMEPRERIYYVTREGHGD